MKANLVSAVCAALALSAFGGLQGAIVNFRADRATCVYEAGETAKLSVTVAETNGVALTSGRVRLVVDNFGNVRSEEREIDLAAGNPFEVRVSRAEPGFARLTVTPADPAQKLDGGVFGVGFSPEKIVSGTPEPADFDAFWSEAIAKLDRTVPVDAQMELVPEKSKGERNYYRVSFATCQGRRVYGWLSEPKDLSGGPFPVRVSVPGAGIGALGVEGDGKTVALLMNVHTYPQPEDDGPYDGGERRRLYDAQDARYAKPNGVARYCQAGIHRSREDYFYYASILGINRAVNWLAARPECDRGDFTYAGTSQGGGFGLMLTALNSHITKSCIFVPAITDLLGFRVGDRQSGWPRIIEAQRPENRAAAERWAPYFCGVNFARRIRVPIRFVAGFADNTCSPNAVYSAYNACPSADKGIFDGIGMGHRVFGDFYTYLGAWQRARTDAKSQYRFLAFNIWGDFFGNPPHERDLREAQVIRNWNPDIVGFQEVTANFWKSRLFPSLEDDYGVVGRGLGPDAAHRDAANPILYRRSRFDLVDSGADWFCPELDYSKGAVWAVLKDRSTGAKVVAFASHFWWQYKGVGDDWIRLQNARRLTALVKGLARKHNAAIIGGGDLNAAMESDAMKSIVADGLADAQATAAVSPKEFQTDHYDPRRDAKGAYYGVPAVRGMADKVWSLDHIFYDPATVSVSRFDLDITPEACALSDHHPIVADFDL